MADWSGSSFLQALGWATLNSIWQMALLWFAYLLLTHLFPFFSYRKYLLSVASVFTGFAWYLFTFASYFFAVPSSDFSLLAFNSKTGVLHTILQAASLAYLLMLVFPAYRIFKNWRILKLIKTRGLEKAPVAQRFFAQKMGMQLGLKKQVKVYLSHLVSSPLTVGFLKPVILLPFTTVNNLTTEQMEAVLLHELSHIRRHDYLLNLFLAFINVILYYNPFVKAFLKQAELEREKCCDEMVLQFQYDKLAYAEALLTLEKTSSSVCLAMAAANQKNLLNRIEKIVGMPQKRKFETAHFLGALTGLLMLLAVQSLVFKGTGQKLPQDVASDYFSQPSTLFLYADEDKTSKKLVVTAKKPQLVATTKSGNSTEVEMHSTLPYVAVESSRNFMTVAYNESDAAGEAAKKEVVQTTVEHTKKVLQSQWTEVEASIADGMTAEEKEEAKKAFISEIDAINWQQVEQGLQSKYDNLDWASIKSNLSEELVKARLDSVETSYKQMLAELHKVEQNSGQNELLLPDVSVQQIAKAKATIKAQLDRVREARNKRIIHL